MNYFGGNSTTYDARIAYYESEFIGKGKDFVKGYIQSVDDRPFSKIINALFMTDNGARYVAAHRELESLTQKQEEVN